VSDDGHKPGCAGWDDCDCFPTADEVRLSQVREWADKYLVGKGYTNARLYEILGAPPPEGVVEAALRSAREEGRREGVEAARAECVASMRRQKSPSEKAVAAALLVNVTALLSPTPPEKETADE
jgi:hypothetical protein